MLVGFFCASWLRAEEAATPFTQAQAETWLAEVLPTLEKVSGRELQGTPLVACVNDETLAKELTHEFKQYLEQIDPSNSANPLLAEMDAAFLAKSMLGKYSPRQQKVLLVPENFSRVMAKLDLPAAQTEALVKVVLLHELTHQLQDEAIDLQASMLAQDSMEPMQALMAAIEGQAVLFHELGGEALGLGKAVERVNYVLPGGGFLREQYPNYSKQLDSTGIYKKLTYDYGAAYMRKLYNEGGAAATWQALEEAPVDLNVILTARNVVHDGKDYLERLKGIEELFSTAPWRTKVMALDEAAMRSQFDHMTAEERADMLDTIISTTALIAGQQVNNQPRMLMISVMVLSDPSRQQIVRDFVASNLEGQKQKFAGQGIDINMKERAFSLPDGVEVTEQNLIISAESESTDQFYFALMIRGDVAAQCVFIGFPQPSQAQYREVAERIFGE